MKVRCNGKTYFLNNNPAIPIEDNRKIAGYLRTVGFQQRKDEEWINPKTKVVLSITKKHLIIKEYPTKYEGNQALLVGYVGNGKNLYRKQKKEKEALKMLRTLAQYWLFGRKISH